MFKFVTDRRSDGRSDGRTDAGGSLHRLTLFTHVSQKLDKGVSKAAASWIEMNNMSKLRD